MKEKKIFSGLGTLILSVAIIASYAQSPGMGNSQGVPGVDYVLSKGGLNIWSNLDGNQTPNEYIYLNVNAPGVGNKDGTALWYSNPTAWLTHNEFHLNNASLLMHNNKINFGSMLSKRKINLWSDRDNDHQFYGFGVLTNALHYQVNSESASHDFFAGVDAGGSRALFRIKGNGLIQMPTSGKLEFGADAAGKDVDAGKIAYQVWSNGLDIVGAGTSSLNRKISFFNEGGATFKGGVFIGSGNYGTGTAEAVRSRYESMPEALRSKYRLFVQMGILSEDYSIAPKEQWADYVFDDSYVLPDLEMVNEFIRDNRHLPGIPSLKDVKANGYNLHEINVKLLEKIEELTLYIIAQEKKLKKQAEEYENLSARLARLEQQLGL